MVSSGDIKKQIRIAAEKEEKEFYNGRAPESWLEDLDRADVSDLKRFCLAGGFARYINLENAICMGLLPEIPLEHYEVIGNGSLAGAFRALVDSAATEAFKAIALVPEIVELNMEPAFETHFIDALALPNLDEDDFPETIATIESPVSIGASA